MDTVIKSLKNSKMGRCLYSGIVAILFQHFSGFIIDRVTFLGTESVQIITVSFSGDHLTRFDSKRVQVFGREIRPEVGTMSPNGAVFHQPVLEEYLLS